MIKLIRSAIERILSNVPGSSSSHKDKILCFLCALICRFDSRLRRKREKKSWRSPRKIDIGGFGSHHAMAADFDAKEVLSAALTCRTRYRTMISCSSDCDEHALRPLQELPL